MATLSLERENELEALHNVRIKIINAAILISWTMIAGLILVSMFQPHAFGKLIWDLIYSAILFNLVAAILPWKNIIRKKTGFNFTFVLSVVSSVLIASVNYYFDTNRIFPFVLVIIFSAVFYDRLRFIILTFISISGLAISMLPSAATDMIVIEVVGLTIFAFLSYRLSDSYKNELATNYVKSKHLAEKVEQLQQINKVSLMLVSKFYLEDFIESFLEISKETTKAKHVIYISIENNNCACYQGKHKNPLPENFVNSPLYRSIMNGEEASLPDGSLTCCAELNLGNEHTFVSPVKYQDHVYGALVWVGGISNTENKFLLNTINNHAALGIFKGHMLDQIQEAKRILEEKDLLKQELLKRLMNVQEDERKRIARELHDEIGQTLNSLLISIELTYKKVTDAQVKDTLEILINDIQGTISEVDRIVWSLRPTILDDLGLAAALRSLAKRFTERIGLKVELCFNGSCRLPDETETAFYRVAQEALNNVVKHSSADHVNIKIDCDGPMIRMTIVDNGSGFKDTKAKETDVGHTMGIQGMKERLSMFGGDLSIITDSDGTTLQAVIPLKGNAADAGDSQKVTV